jgi:hypothetical protein
MDQFKKVVVEAKMLVGHPQPQLEKNVITLYGFMRVHLWQSHRTAIYWVRV